MVTAVQKMTISIRFSQGFSQKSWNEAGIMALCKPYANPIEQHIVDGSSILQMIISMIFKYLGQTVCEADPGCARRIEVPLPRTLWDSQPTFQIPFLRFVEAIDTWHIFVQMAKSVIYWLPLKAICPRKLAASESASSLTSATIWLRRAPGLGHYKALRKGLSSSSILEPADSVVEAQKKLIAQVIASKLVGKTHTLKDLTGVLYASAVDKENKGSSMKPI
ncbi:hypothetical protein BDP27DRAFT_1369600 [Rhodocollybia butyracea]|uniref:Uncharacterized protein n=1 Tax=Rhodocollybia butyracea TaxID=206335 RepID=A0A9P5PDM0_9AGAR|nr:hypothetical protein BDP27DRAFT_1369600 [Rhodocollybia butyracea]